MQAIEVKDEEITKLKKNFRDVSRNHDAKRERIMSLKKEYDRFDKEFNSKQEEERKGR